MVRAKIGGRVEVVDHFCLEVDKDQTIERCIELGRYDWVDQDVYLARSAGLPGGRCTEYVSLVLGWEGMSTEDILTALRELQLEPAGLHSLLGLGSRFPNIQLRRAVIALGSVWRNPRGKRVVPELTHLGSLRWLSTTSYANTWLYRTFFCARPIDVMA